MERKLVFYGTPLNRSLNNDQQDDIGPINSRKARLNKQQTVRDSQGRQRFHGAFTGGYSAGYFNTVDSTAGFQPRQFVSHRDNKRQNGAGTSFSHKPEDYMDEEDLGEFGIAPKKIRVSNQYSNDNVVPGSSNLDDSALRGLLRPVTLSIGELILKRMSKSCISHQNNHEVINNALNSQRFTTKNNFHGLGYKPLEVASRQHESSNPLTAILGGKRLKISGEAFGMGVIDDDEDYVTTNDAYGYDDMRNYEFDRKSRALSDQSKNLSLSKSNDDKLERDHCQISGFILAKHINAMQIGDNIQKIYSPPTIADNWKMPTRVEPYIPPLSSSSITLKLNLESSQSSFTKKFTSGSQSIRSDDIIPKAGLVLYSDLKANESNAIGNLNQAIVESQTTEASMVRKELEWRPCSLLCKHFNVPNPYPDNLYVGVKPSNLTVQYDDLASSSSSVDVRLRQQHSCKEMYQEPASLELKRMIFDRIFTNHSTRDYEEVKLYKDRENDYSEDEPQVVELVEEIIGFEKDDQQVANEASEDDDLDVLVVSAPRRDPEVIVLSSSSSHSSPSLSQQQPSRSSSPAAQPIHGNDVCHMAPAAPDTSDIYGPPIPPTLRTLIDLDRRDQRHRSGLSGRKKKKKHKKSKRNS